MEGGGTTVGRMEEEQYDMHCFILIQRPVRGGRYLLIILFYYLTEKMCLFMFAEY